MKHIFHLSLFALLIIIGFLPVSCKSKVETQRIPENMHGIKVNGLAVNTQLDSLSYALGSLWGQDMKKSGLRVISNAFYFGAFDYINHNADSIMGFKQANNYLKSRFSTMLLQTKDLPLDDDMLFNKIAIKTPFDTFSYALGYVMSKRAYAFGIDDVNPALLTGIMACLNGDSSMFDYASANQYLNIYVENRLVALNGDIKRENEAWFDSNAKKPGVIIHPSGIQYKVLKEGHGRRPDTSDIFVCNYTMRLIDGTVIDSQHATGEPLKFYIEAVIPGWGEAMLSMRVGDSWEVYIPSELGYRSRGLHQKIPPFSNIIMDIDFVDAINPKDYH
jgi:FKBP-type peptidyl-prolyl cis-trans isomerase FklB